MARYGLILIQDGNETETETGYATADEAVAEALRRNEQPSGRFNEDTGRPIDRGEWFAFEVGTGRTF